MKKLIILFALVFMALVMPKNSFAQQVSHPSARLAPIEAIDTVDPLDTRVRALKNVLNKYNSPLTEKALAFVAYADEFNVDWKLLPAVSGLESSFGIHLMPESYNAYGWGGGHIYFDSWEDGIRTINRALRENYINRGATDVWSIGPIYAESKTWSVRVNRFMQEIDQEYQKLSTFSVLSDI